MKIIFWGSDRDSGVISNMLILATYLSCRKGYRIAIIDLANAKDEIEGCFSGIDEFYRGPYIKTLARRQLYYVSTEIWIPTEKEKCIEIIKYLECNMDIVFVCIVGASDMEAKRLMYHADLVVINVKQEWKALEQYFAKYAHFSERILIVIGDYYEGGGCDKTQIEEKYHISRNVLAVIPYNPEYQEARRRHRIDHYLRQRDEAQWTVMKSRFLRTIDETAELLYETAKVSVNEQEMAH